MDFLTFRGDGLLRYLQRGFGIFDAALRILSAHHDFQLAVFGFGDFGLGIGDFVLQRLVGFVGFHSAALFAVFLGAVFPLLHVQLKFLALGEAVGMGFASCGDGITSAGKLQVCFLDTFGKGFELGPQSGDVQVDRLQLKKARNCRVHATQV